MSHPNQPIYGVENLHLFPRYQTREAYAAATGEQPPAWDPSKPPKFWFDPAARTSTKRTFTYERALVTGETSAVLPDDAGKPMVDTLSMLRTVAAAVNIPPNESNIEGADVPEIPVPLRALEEGEELFFQFGSAVAVRYLPLYNALKEGFTADDRALLKAIATKLGI